MATIEFYGLEFMRDNGPVWDTRWNSYISNRENTLAIFNHDQVDEAMKEYAAKDNAIKRWSYDYDTDTVSFERILG